MHDFARTTCACATCVECCESQPGALAPGDFERIAEHLGLEASAAARSFWASPGAIVGDSVTGARYRIGTITPKREHGRCVFLDEQKRCRIHTVAPFGCSHFDTHMSAVEGQRRGMWLLHEIVTSPEYNALRATLTEATSWNPRRY